MTQIQLRETFYLIKLSGIIEAYDTPLNHPPDKHLSVISSHMPRRNQ